MDAKTQTVLHISLKINLGIKTNFGSGKRIMIWLAGKAVIDLRLFANQRIEDEIARDRKCEFGVEIEAGENLNER